MPYVLKNETKEPITVSALGMVVGPRSSSRILTQPEVNVLWSLNEEIPGLKLDPVRDDQEPAPTLEKKVKPMRTSEAAKASPEESRAKQP